MKPCAPASPRHVIAGPDAAERLAALIEELAQAGIVIKVADAPRPFRKEMNRVGLTDQPGPQQFDVSVKTAGENGTAWRVMGHLLAVAIASRMASEGLRY